MQNKSLWGNFLNCYYSNKATNDFTQAENQKRIQSYDEFEKAFYEKHQVEAEEPVIPEEVEEPIIPEENDYLENNADIDKSLKSALDQNENSERNLDEVSEDELAEFKALNGIDDEDIVVDQPTETKVKSIKVSKTEKAEKKQQRVKAEKKQTKVGKKQAKTAK